MEQMPCELIHMIVDEVAKEQTFSSKTDLCSLRLVNKNLGQAAIAPLFHEIPLWLGASSLRNLVDMSQHPTIIAQHIRRIVVSTLRFEEQLDAENYLLAVKEEFMEYLERHSSRREATRAFKKFELAYIHYQDCQRQLSEDGLDVKMLTQAFDRLLQLDAILLDELSDIGTTKLTRDFGTSLWQSHTDAGVPEDSPSWRTTSFDGDYVLPALFEALAQSDVCFRSFQMGPFVKERREKGDDILAAAELEWYESRRMVPKAFTGLLSLTNGKVFPSLQELIIHQLPEMDHYYSTKPQVSAFVRELLGRCPNLTALQIGQSFEYTFDELIPFEKAFENVSVQSLRRLGLRNFGFSVHNLAKFLSRNAPTLADVQFSYCGIYDGGTWFSIFEELRASAFSPCLENFALDNCDGNAENVSACDFLTHKNDRNPMSAGSDLQKSSEGGNVVG